MARTLRREGRQVNEIPLEVLSDLVNAGLSHGAVKLWLVMLVEIMGEHHATVGYRRLVELVGCDIHSLRGWIDELCNGGWLYYNAAASKLGARRHYSILDGTRKPLTKRNNTPAGKTATDCSAQPARSGVRKQTTVSNSLYRKETTDCSAQPTRILSKESSNSNTVTPSVSSIGTEPRASASSASVNSAQKQPSSALSPGTESEPSHIIPGLLK
jgi:hypothetical protein